MQFKIHIQLKIKYSLLKQEFFELIFLKLLRLSSFLFTYKKYALASALDKIPSFRQILKLFRSFKRLNRRVILLIFQYISLAGIVELLSGQRGTCSFSRNKRVEGGDSKGVVEKSN